MYILNQHNTTTPIKRILTVLLAIAAMLVISIAPTLPAGAVAVTDTTATGEVKIKPGQSFILTITTDGDDEIGILGVRHNLEAAFPAFSAAANEADPYPGGGGQEYFESLGASLAYNEATRTWTIDFGESVTQQLMSVGNITFYLGLYGSGSTLLWGSSDEAGATEANTFSYTLVEDNEEGGDEDEAINDENAADTEGGGGANGTNQESAIIPKVPNTGFQPTTSSNPFTVASTVAATVIIAGGVVASILRRQ